MFSNRSVKLFTLKNRFLITAKVLHSIRMCLTVQVVWQVKHCGCGFCFKMKEWLSLVWPIRNRDITTCSLLDFLDAGLHSPKIYLFHCSFIRLSLAQNYIFKIWWFIYNSNWFKMYFNNLGGKRFLKLFWVLILQNFCAQSNIICEFTNKFLKLRVIFYLYVVST